MSKLNAFIAAIPANGLPSPSGPKSPSMPSDKAFPSLSIPQDDSQDEGMISVNEPQKIAQPTTPQPQFLRRGGSTRAPRGSSVRDIARRFDSQKGFSTAPLSTDESPNSNQEDEASDRKTTTPKPSLPPLCPTVPQANTPNKTRSPSSSACIRRSLDDGEAGPLKRLSATHERQQHEQLQGQHHRRISTGTAAFSKMLKKQPDEDIDTGVVQYFGQLPIATISRPEQSNNQADEPHELDPLELLAAFSHGETISVAVALSILQKATDVMTLESNVVAVQAPVTIVGDLHGQFSDLVEIFAVHRAPSPTNPFLFLGDYVDRGVASCEIILLLLACKARWPHHVHLLRGNHECRALSTFYGFRAECLAKYGLAVYNRTVKCFESMPLAATIATARGTFLAVHGGLSPSIERVEQINDLVDRFTEPDPHGALCDLLWADPAKDSVTQDEPFAPNAVRGCSYTFNEEVCREFLARNELLAIIRAHELEEHGFREHFHASPMADHEFPPVITVFSAPEYCNINHNLGATLGIHWDGPNLLEYRQHMRSSKREVAFTGQSEDDAIKTLLQEQLPFLPVDFYDLVAVTRQLQASLDVAASIATPAASSASNVVQDATVGNEPTKITEVTKSQAEPRTSVDRTSTQGEAVSLSRPTTITTLPTPYIRVNKPRRRASTGSGLRLCPGFMRFCEKYLGVQFNEPPRSASLIIEPKKRRTIDDIHVNPTPTTPVVTKPTDVSDVRLEEVIVPKVAGTKNRLEIFTPTQWTALRLYFNLLDVSGMGVLMEESFVVLLAEQDSDAYATQDELTLLMDVVDGNGDGLITLQDFLQFAYRACLHWKKTTTPRFPKL